MGFASSPPTQSTLSIPAPADAGCVWMARCSAACLTDSRIKHIRIVPLRKKNIKRDTVTNTNSNTTIARASRLAPLHSRPLSLTASTNAWCAWIGGWPAACLRDSLKNPGTRKPQWIFGKRLTMFVTNVTSEAGASRFTTLKRNFLARCELENRIRSKFCGTTNSSLEQHTRCHRATSWDSRVTARDVD